MHLKLKKIIDDYVECNNFEIKIIDGKVKIYYYDNNFYIDIDNLTNKEIIKLSEFYEITYGKEYEKISLFDLWVYI